jgi:hypothetical protein
MKIVLTAILLIFCVNYAQADIVVIGNLKSSLSLLSAVQLEDIFMGRTRSLPNGQVALPIDQSLLRAEFYQKLTSRPVEQIDAYWARIKFTGLASPPDELANDNAVVDAVLSKSSETTNAIGYIDSTNVDKRVRVLLILN